MKKQQALEHLCAVTKQVQIFFEKEVGTVPAADCFCGANPYSDDNHFAIDENVIQFIEIAVAEKIKQTARPRSEDSPVPTSSLHFNEKTGLYESRQWYGAQED
jgi:hypothetical protein